MYAILYFYTSAASRTAFKAAPNIELNHKTEVIVTKKSAGLHESKNGTWFPAGRELLNSIKLSFSSTEAKFAAKQADTILPHLM